MMEAPAIPAEIARHFAPPRRAGAWRGTVWAAVLTYDRKETLLLCLAALQAQAEGPDRIVIVDNGSTDGTPELLAAHGLLDDPLFRYVRLEANIGAAAGYGRLFREVWQAGADWGWFMDDDAIAAPAALAELKRAFAEHFERPEEVGFLISNSVTPDGKPNDVPMIDDRRAPNSCAEWGDLLGSALVKLRSSALNSVLIPRSTLAEFGAPSLDFEVWGEDTDYCLRVTQSRPGFLVGTSRIVHLRGVAGDLDIFSEPDGPRLERYYQLYRNTLYLRRRYWPRYAVYLFLGKALLHLLRCLVFPRRPLKRASLILRGTLAGFFFAPRPVALDRALTPDDRDGRRGSTAPGRAAPAA